MIRKDNAIFVPTPKGENVVVFGFSEKLRVRRLYHYDKLLSLRTTIISSPFSSLCCSRLVRVAFPPNLDVLACEVKHEEEDRGAHFGVFECQERPYRAPCQSDDHPAVSPQPVHSASSRRIIHVILLDTLVNRPQSGEVQFVLVANCLHMLSVMSFRAMQAALSNSAR